MRRYPLDPARQRQFDEFLQRRGRAGELAENSRSVERARLGGHPTRDGARRAAFRCADDLVQLTDEGMQALADYGVRTVIDLRWPGEVAAKPHPVAARMRRAISQHLATRDDEMQWASLTGECTKEMWKCAVLEHTRPQLKEVLEVIADATAEPLMFHCVAGKDRPA